MATKSKQATYKLNFSGLFFLVLMQTLFGNFTIALLPPRHVHDEHEVLHGSSLRNVVNPTKTTAPQVRLHPGVIASVVIVALAAVLAAVFIIRKFCFPQSDVTYRYSVLRQLEEQRNSNEEQRFDREEESSDEFTPVITELVNFGGSFIRCPQIFEMRSRDFVRVAVVLIVILFIWGISTKRPYVQEHARDVRGLFGPPPKVEHVSKAGETPAPKCFLQKDCPLDHFAFHIRSGAANVVGPKICFDGQVIVSGVKNNVGPGMNIVLVDGETGKTVDSNYFNMYSGDAEELLVFLKTIKPGYIVLVATFDDPATKLTDEIRDIFAGLGSSKIKSVKFRDNWVFAGCSAVENSPFERLLPNNGQNNTYGDWPEMVQMGGCFPRKI